MLKEFALCKNLVKPLFPLGFGKASKGGIGELCFMKWNKKNVIILSFICIAICIVVCINWNYTKGLISMIIDWFKELEFWKAIVASIVATILFGIIITILSFIFGNFLSRLKDKFFNRIAEEVKMGITVEENFIDKRDKKKYRIVKIGRQIWMAENLNYDIQGSKCYDETYGRLYDWETAKKACPQGWHLPTDDEWKILANFAGGIRAAGRKLKTTNGWTNNNGTDDYGFSALPGGDCNPNGNFSGVGDFGSWWADDEYDAKQAYNWYLDVHGFKYKAWYKDGYFDKSQLFSVRCIKD
ncbi:MAG: hypothetical protein FWF63_05795 [Fibromonadales bacterium]|nr:hypothetical protein [Fibromonadales bacterium]